MWLYLLTLLEHTRNFIYYLKFHTGDNYDAKKIILPLLFNLNTYY